MIPLSYQNSFEETMATEISRREQIIRGEIEAYFQQIPSESKETSDKYETRFLFVEQAFERARSKIMDLFTWVIQQQGLLLVKRLRALYDDEFDEERRKKEEHEVKQIYQEILFQAIDLRCQLLSQKIDFEINFFKTSNKKKYVTKTEILFCTVKKIQKLFLERKESVRGIANNIIHILRSPKRKEMGVFTGWNPFTGFRDKYNLDALAGQPSLDPYKPAAQREELQTESKDNESAQPKESADELL